MTDWIHSLGTAALLGLVGGFHCLGMCGPLALAIPGDHPLRAFLYHLGRITTYSLLGLGAGLIGGLLRIAGFQQWMSIISGVTILLLVWLPGAHISLVSGKWFSLLGKYTNPRSAVFLWFSGMLNGLLPCGLVYVAMAGSLTAPGTAGSMLYMAVFGLGTLPLLLVLAFAGTLLPAGARSGFRKMIPYAASLVACLLIVRGMNLGIPYLSPKIEKGQAECCKAAPVSEKR